jgi:hypothetical protein
MRCRFRHDDGGREAAGFKGSTGDCVTRAIAIATEKPYAEVYESINAIAYGMDGRLSYGSRSPAASGVFRKTYDAYLKALGWEFIPCVMIGSGCKVHLRKDELPDGRIIVRLSKHLSTVVDGVIRDTFNPSRNGTRCVYGFYAKGLCLWQIPLRLEWALRELGSPTLTKLEEEGE